MTDFETLPRDLHGGTSYVVTVLGTTHVMTFAGGLTWQRVPAPSADPEATIAPRAVERIDAMWRVGFCGYVLCADEIYPAGPSQYVTAEIIRITDDPTSLGQHFATSWTKP